MWALYTLIVLIVLVIVVLCIPVEFIFDFNTSEFSKRKFEFRWLFGLLRFKVQKAEKARPEAKSVKPASNKQKLQPGEILEILQVEGLFSQVKRLLSDIFTAVKIPRLSADIILGLEDPVHYGYLFAFTAPVNYLLGLTPYRIAVNAVFEGQLILECIAAGAIRVYPVMLFGSMLAFIFSAPGFRIIRIMVKTWR